MYLENNFRRLAQVHRTTILAIIHIWMVLSKKNEDAWDVAAGASPRK